MRILSWKVFLLLLCSTSSYGKNVDISFKSLLFCENPRKSVVYIIGSFNVDSFTKLNTILYFTDGTPNTPYSDWYSASDHSISENTFKVQLKQLVGQRASNFKPQLSGDLASCTITVSKDWKSQIKKASKDVESFTTKDFEAFCEFPLGPLEKCRSKKDLSEKFKIVSPYDGKNQSISEEFNYSSW